MNGGGSASLHGTSKLGVSLWEGRSEVKPPEDSRLQARVQERREADASVRMRAAGGAPTRAARREAITWRPLAEASAERERALAKVAYRMTESRLQEKRQPPACATPPECPEARSRPGP